MTSYGITGPRWVSIALLSVRAVHSKVYPIDTSVQGFYFQSFKYNGQKIDYIRSLHAFKQLIRSSHAHIDGLVQERRNSSALAMELRLSCTNHRYNTF